MRRGRRAPALDPDMRMQQRVSLAEGKPEPWRSGQTSWSGPVRQVVGEINVVNPAFINQGTGFTAAWVNTGIVDITFTPAFPSPPVVVGCGANGSGVVVQDFTQLTASKCRLIMVTVPGAAGVNGRITFIATGLNA